MLFELQEAYGNLWLHSLEAFYMRNGGLGREWGGFLGEVRKTHMFSPRTAFIGSFKKNVVEIKFILLSF